MIGTRKSGESLWTIEIPRTVKSDHIPPPIQWNRQGMYIKANYASKLDAASYVKFVHAALGYPAPSTFLNAVSRGYINGPNQFSRLTTKMVRKHMPNSLATARGHLDKTAAKPPHQNSQAVSALQRFQTRNQRKEMHNRQKELEKPVVSKFDYAKVPK
jgi:hypothetical protein